MAGRKNLKQLVEDGKNTRWKKGQKPEGAGRPRKLPSLDAVLTRVFGVTSDDEVSKIDMLMESMYKHAIKKGNVQAANLIIERMHGKVAQKVQMQVGVSKEDVGKLFPFAPPEDGKE